MFSPERDQKQPERKEKVKSLLRKVVVIATIIGLSLFSATGVLAQNSQINLVVDVPWSESVTATYQNGDETADLKVTLLDYIQFPECTGDWTPDFADIPATEQWPGEHSTLSTYDRNIRDDELADYICSKIPKVEGVPQVKDVKIMFNSCYGGGMLDDIERVFGPGGACEGVPWVAGSASTGDEPAWGPSNAAVGESDRGSYWTDALKDAITGGGNVLQSFKDARDNDTRGPNGTGLENPQVASGNGGENITWEASGNKKSIVVFGGKNNRTRHDNNIENMADVLDNWGITYMGYGWGDSSTGTTAHLKGLIDAACSHLDSDTQLILYFNDHGDTDFDVDEFLDWVLPYYIYDLISIEFDLHAGWEEGLTAMHNQGDDPSPFINLELVELIYGEEWSMLLNSVTIPLPAGNLTGELQLPVNWTSIHTGTNYLQIFPLDEPTGPMVLDNLELGSGPINEAEPPVVAVGGIAELPDITETSARNYPALAGLIAAATVGVITLIGAARYARRRLS